MTLDKQRENKIHVQCIIIFQYQTFKCNQQLLNIYTN